MGSGLNPIAAQMDQAVQRRRALHEAGSESSKLLASGGSWSVLDFLCTRGPEDRPFEEQHAGVSISMVVAGTFDYRCSKRPELLTPGSLLLGNDEQPFECSHQHASGDRCVAFKYTPEYFEQIAADAGARVAAFSAARVPPLPELARVCAGVWSGLLGVSQIAWGELSLMIAARVLHLDGRMSERAVRTSRKADAAVIDVVRFIERDPSSNFTLDEMAAQAGLSAFHFLRIFQSK